MSLRPDDSAHKPDRYAAAIRSIHRYITHTVTANATPPIQIRPSSARTSAVENYVPDTTKNTTTARRIVIADSGDLAYDYSDGMLEFDLKDGTHVTSPNSTLRVRQKQDGQWKMAANF